MDPSQAGRSHQGKEGKVYYRRLGEGSSGTSREVAWIVTRTKARARDAAPVAFAGLLVVLVAAGAAGSLAPVDMARGGRLDAGTTAASSDPVITVDGNAQLAGVPGILGNGTAGNPYIIQ